MPPRTPIPRHRIRRVAPVIGALIVLGPAVVPASTAHAASAADARKARASRPVDINAGGTYRVAAGSPVTLRATYAVAGQTKTVADLQAIGAALKAYVAANGSYPPAALSNDAGTPTVSWRVLLLPFLGYADLYKRFDLTKRWDDPANAPLLAQMPPVFRAVGAGKATTTTGYAGVAGAKQLFQSAQPRPGLGVRDAWVSDGADMTIAVGPVGRNVTIPWTAPGDIEVATTAALGTPKGFDGAGTVATSMLFLDGTVRAIPDIIETNNILSWSTIAGGGCSPPSALELRLQPQWDLDGSGTFATVGSVATLARATKGTRVVKFRVVDDLGGLHVASAQVAAR